MRIFVPYPTYMQTVIEQIKEEIQKQFETLEGSHDWFHIQRVYQNALSICEEEPTADKTIVAVLALVHDISDHKLNGGKLNQGSREAKLFLNKLGAPTDLINKVAPLVDEISFKGAQVSDQMSCLEAKIVQDADRLDAIGAIGIARAFAYGGSKNRPLYDPQSKPESHTDFKAYSSAKSHTVNHFYEKLLLLKDRMHTTKGKRLAEERHEFMRNFLTQFYKEWNADS